MVAQMSHEPDLPENGSTRRAGRRPSSCAGLRASRWPAWSAGRPLAPGPRPPRARSRPVTPTRSGRSSSNTATAATAWGRRRGAWRWTRSRMRRPPRNAPKLWHAVLKNVRSGIMPPADKPQPSAEDRRLLEDWIKYGALGIDPDGPRPGSRHGPPAQPGRVPQHDPRPDRRRLRHHLRVPAGRHRARVRQHRRRADALPDAAGEVPQRGQRDHRPGRADGPEGRRGAGDPGRELPARRGRARSRPARPSCPITSRRRCRPRSTSSTTAAIG